MVQVKKSRSLNVHIDNVYSEYLHTENHVLIHYDEVQRYTKDIFVWRNATTSKLIGRREVFRIGNNYVNLCLN